MASDAPPRERPPPASACASSSLAPAGTGCRSRPLTWDALTWDAVPRARTWARMKDRLEQLKAVSLRRLGIRRAGGCGGSAARRSGVGEGLPLAPLTQVAGVLCALGLSP